MASTRFQMIIGNIGSPRGSTIRATYPQFRCDNCIKRTVRQSALLCRAGLEQVGREACRTRVRNAGDRAQVFVDGLDVIVGHVALDGPRHDLENIGGEGRRSNATLRT